MSKLYKRKKKPRFSTFIAKSCRVSASMQRFRKAFDFLRLFWPAKASGKRGDSYLYVTGGASGVG